MSYIIDIGLEVHAELATRSKMFCSCPVVEPTQTQPNSAVCPVCLGLPGTLPVVNQQAVEFGLRAALALNCTIASTSIFARKNYFYPDLPKGYQISQYEYPLAEHGILPIRTSQGNKHIRIHRVHLEEDTGKLTHMDTGDENYTLVDLNRAGIPLLEIVSEPDLHSAEEARAYAEGLRNLLRHLGINSGDMEKGAIRFEANVSIRPEECSTLGTRVEIKNLNSFRSMEHAIAYQVEQQTKILEAGEQVVQETLGWDPDKEITFSQRSKEEAHDYRYFPEPDLPPLVVDQEWIKRIAREIPELPFARYDRFMEQYGLSDPGAALLTEDDATASYFEDCVRLAGEVPIHLIFNWMTGEIFAFLNQTGCQIDTIKVQPKEFMELLHYVHSKKITLNTAKSVLVEMLQTGNTARSLIEKKGLLQVSDVEEIADLISEVLNAHPEEMRSYLAGKETLSNWFFGQVMRKASGKADPQVLRTELEKQLLDKRSSQ
ncbi:MAG: Asp-tRNA(Asn)/Glu-tRNA(Gln) amidotransferase subunit GatB [Anaerolineaceae bacterium]